MPFTVVQEASVLPVSVDMIKQHTNITFDADDALLGAYLRAAVIYGEGMTGRKFIESTFELDLDTFPSGKIALRPDLQGVSEISYTDANGDGQVVDSTEYKVKKTALVGFLAPVDSWPSSAEDVLITFTAGWPIVDESVTTPADIVLWLMAKVADYYANRENYIVADGGGIGVVEMPKTYIDNMLSLRIVPGVGGGI